MTSSEFLTLTTVVLDPESFHRLGMRALVLDIHHSDMLTRLNQGPLEVTEDDISPVLNSAYGSGDTCRKAGEVRASLLEFFRDYGQGRIFRISIEEERPALADSLRADSLASVLVAAGL